MKNSQLDEWTTKLSRVIAKVLREFRNQVEDQIELFAVDCHPWNGVIDLSLLTHSEVRDDPLLTDPAEMAIWKYFHFASGINSWRPALDLALQMREAYKESSEKRATTVESYLLACAAALKAAEVQDALSQYDLTRSFRISVSHPDTNREYYR